MTIENLRAFCKYNILTSSEVAERLEVSRQRVNALVKTGELKPVKQTSQVSLFFLADVEGYLRKKGKIFLKPSISPPFLYDESGSTRKSKEFFENNRSLMGDICAIYVYFDEIDAALDNFFLPSSSSRYGNLHHVETPGLILKDTTGKEMWLGGCNCGYGGEGPHGSEYILKQLGFDEKHTDNVFKYRIVKFIKDENNNFEIYTRNSPFDFRTDYGSNNAHLYFFENRLILIQTSHTFRTDPLKILERYMAFLPNPTEFTIFPSYDLAKKHGYVVPGLYGEIIYNIIIQDVSGRQLWLHTYVDKSEPIENQSTPKSLLSMTGFDIPKENAITKPYSTFKTWLNTNLRKVPIEPLYFSKK
ncbi:MAG: helix-turn-helix domain-containing protein [Bacillota bacterium]